MREVRVHKAGAEAMNTTGPANKLFKPEFLLDNALSAHIETMKRLRSTVDRRQYLSDLERIEGKERADYVADRYVQWWDYREQQRKAGVR